ncbi:uncharacterized protein LOC117638650 [Prunus dulcis]|uniref:uncharacterized protein LOC117638650 n=1 Tax=Prunus dulcis TaxID=3755 RepID=UPI001481E65C|nr:uncharacterized protein LOC117638650 [Prunus dulcis]
MKNSLESSEPEENSTNALSGPSENTVSLNPEIENKMEEAPEQQHEGKQDSSLPLDFILDDIAKLRKLVPPTRDDPNRFPKFIFKMMMSHLENKDSDAGGEDVRTSICEEEQSEVDVMDLDEDPQLWPEEVRK